MITPTATNTPATLPVESQNDVVTDPTPAVSDDGLELFGNPVELRALADSEPAPFPRDPVGETVVVGSLGTKLVTTTVVPWFTVTVAIDLEERVDWGLSLLLSSVFVDDAVAADTTPDCSPI